MLVAGGSRTAATSALKLGARQSFFTLFYDWYTIVQPRQTKYGCRTFHEARQLMRTDRPALQPRIRQYGAIARYSTNASTNASTEPAISSSLRRMMRSMPHSVVVATATSPSTETEAMPQYRGMTLSSFTTLTLTPQPIVTFNIRKPSSTLSAIRESKQFFVHILSATASGANVAKAFAQGNRVDVFHSNAFTVLALKDRHAPPLLAAEGITKVLRCEVLEGEQPGLVEVGDHTLVLARVVSIIDPGHSSADGDAAHGLCYVDGQYRVIGSGIDP